METTTKTFLISWTNGRADVDGLTYDEAIALLRRTYPEAVIGHDGDLMDGGDRTLVWTDAASAENDPGVYAVAEIREVRS